MASALGGNTAYIREPFLAFGSSLAPTTFTSSIVCDNYVVTFLGHKNSVNFISMANIGDIVNVNLIDEAFKRFQAVGCVPADVQVAVRGGWKNEPSSFSLGEQILERIKVFREKIDVKNMWKKEPLVLTKRKDLTIGPESSFKGFSFNSKSGKVSEIPEAIPALSDAEEVILKRVQSFKQIRKADLDDLKEKTISSFKELSIAGVSSSSGSSTQADPTSSFRSKAEMTKQITEQWEDAFGSSGNQTASVPGHGDLDDEKELAELMKQIELRENGPAAAAPASKK